MQASNLHYYAIIVDEYGGKLLQAFAIMDDIIEELGVGKIYDEHDTVEREVTDLIDGSYSVKEELMLKNSLNYRWRYRHRCDDGKWHWARPHPQRFERYIRVWMKTRFRGVEPSQERMPRELHFRLHIRVEDKPHEDEDDN